MLLVDDITALLVLLLVTGENICVAVIRVGARETQCVGWWGKDTSGLGRIIWSKLGAFWKEIGVKYVSGVIWLI